MSPQPQFKMHPTSTHLMASAPSLSWHTPLMLQEWSHLLQEALPDCVVRGNTYYAALVLQLLLHAWVPSPVCWTIWWPPRAALYLYDTSQMFPAYC